MAGLCLFLPHLLPTTALAQTIPPNLPQTSPQQLGTAGSQLPTALVGQPVAVNTFESVETERLRLAAELAKVERDDTEFREQVAKLQAKLAGISLSLAPASLPSEHRSFLSANAGDIAKSDAYYALLKSCLNELTPDSPYRSRLQGDTSNPLKASQKLSKLSEYQEDDDICRTIRGHIASLSGGRVDDRNRLNDIERELNNLAEERRRLQWNLRMASTYSPLSGERRGSDEEMEQYRKEIAEAEERMAELRAEKKNLSHLVTAALRKLQFQQFIIELAVQQRYLHSLIACGFYRNSFKGGDLAISKDAYPAKPSTESGQNAGGAQAIPQPSIPSAAGVPVSTPPTNELPAISTITGLESFLLNRVRDGIKDRQAIDNMLKEKQMSAAESVLRKMILTAKYQPELQTIPYADRQRIQQFSQTVKNLSDALNAKDYDEISRLSGELQSTCSDAGISDLKVFAAEHPRKALHWAKQAELAMKAGDPKTASSLIEAAINRAPLDAAVKEKIEGIQDQSISASRAVEELKEIARRQNYKEAFDRMNEFAPLAANGDDAELKSQYEALVALEQSLRAGLEKCDEFVRRGDYAEGWIALSSLDPALQEDPRVNVQKSKIAVKCPNFVAKYSSAVDRESSGARALALAWYLSALPDAPSNEQLQAKITQLGTAVLKD